MGVASSSPTTSGGRSARPRRRPSVAICAGVPRSGFFFFSSRRRHTRSDRDRSSDVCSSDLVVRVDVDAHHYENENYGEFLPYMENDVFRQLIISSRSKSRASITPTQIGYQDMGGRVRSEERRVGKEGRSRGWPDPVQKNIWE